MKILKKLIMVVIVILVFIYQIGCATAPSDHVEIRWCHYIDAHNTNYIYNCSNESVERGEE